MVVHNATQGHYNATWNALALGRTEEGLIWEVTHQGEMLRFEEFGQSIIDMVYRGADLTVEGVFAEWDSAGIQSALWPFSSTFGKQDCVGQFAVDGSFAKPLLLTAEACAPAATDGPATITFHKTIMDPGVASRINLNNKTRLLPLRFRVFLWDTDPSPGPATGTPSRSFFTVT